MVRIPDSHSGDTGSSPVGEKKRYPKFTFNSFFLYLRKFTTSTFFLFLREHAFSRTPFAEAYILHFSSTCMERVVVVVVVIRAAIAVAAEAAAAVG